MFRNFLFTFSLQHSSSVDQLIDSFLALPLPSHHLLTNNDVPLDSDIPVIRRIISDGRKILDALQVPIESLQSILARLAMVEAWNTQIHTTLVDLHATLAQLTQTRDETANTVHEYRAVLSPVRCLPQELICEIFVQVLLSECGENSSRLPQPWRLGHICRSWRRAALSYPRLWPSITFPSLGTRERSAMMEIQLSRSGNTPLDILWEGDKLVESRLLKLVTTHSNRWHVLRLPSHQPLFGDSRSALKWLRPVAGRLAQLRRLEVVTASDNLLVTDVFAAAPALREVVLTDREFSVSSPERINIPWAQITHYRGCYPLSRQLKILQKASNLIECAIGYSPLSPSALSRRILLPQLRRLHLTDAEILDYIDAPLLETLSYRITFRGSSSLIRLRFKSLTKLAFIDSQTSLPSSKVITLLLQDLPRPHVSPSWGPLSRMVTDQAV
ncbi:F-box domain-containing protein [Mycena sanguinolenta]|uniref:F-box domain-containing protein n=1 Tax=Mycena sanguinolenta TaxID=230812 RepID=A0A8H6ZE34_9AGAR|nr:F-box domain-containing protein [Mycena sanguinolenta]